MVKGKAKERDAAQRALVESEARYRDVIESSSDIIFTLDAVGRVIALTTAFDPCTAVPATQSPTRAAIRQDRRQNALDHVGMPIQRGRRITEEILRFTNPVDPVFEAVTLAQWSQAVVHELGPILGNQYTFNVELQQPDLRALADI